MGGRSTSSGMSGNSRFAGTEGVTRSGASDDWFEYENANVMAEFIRTGRMPTSDMNGRSLSIEERQKLAREANLMQEEGSKTNTGQKTLYRGMVMSEEEARSLTPGQTYTIRTLTAATPDSKVASVYSNVDNYYGSGRGVPVIIDMQKSDGIRGFKRDRLGTSGQQALQSAIQKQAQAWLNANPRPANPRKNGYKWNGTKYVKA